MAGKLTKVIYPLIGAAPAHPKEYNNQIKELKDAAKFLDTQIKGKQYFVGDAVTLADLKLAVLLSYGFQLVFEAGYRKQISNLTQWFERVAAHEKYVARFGKVKLAKKTLKPFAYVEEKKEEKKAQPQKAQAAAAPKKEEKPKEGVDALPPPKMDLNNFKNHFFQSADRREGIKMLYNEFRPEDYSVWFFHYEKYTGEGEKLSHTSNLMNGFLQRCDPFRKYTLSCHCVLGEEPNLEIMGVWLFRGPEMLDMMKENPQFEYHKVRKMDIINNSEDKDLFEQFVFGEEDKDKANGHIIQVKKFFK